MQPCGAQERQSRARAEASRDRAAQLAFKEIPNTINRKTQKIKRVRNACESGERGSRSVERAQAYGTGGRAAYRRRRQTCERAAYRHFKAVSAQSSDGSVPVSLVNQVNLPPLRAVRVWIKQGVREWVT